MRLFVALNLPASIRQGLWEAGAPLRSRAFPVRWVQADALHVTVKFLGEVDAADLPAAQAALGRAASGARVLVVTIAGFGVFPQAGPPRVVWAGLEGGPALELLHHDAEQALAPLGFPPEGRPFRPHVTLGRVARDARGSDFDGLTELLGDLHYEATAEIASLDLMETLPGARGVTYQVRHSERLS